MWKFDLQNKDVTNCYDNMIVTILNHFGYDYKLMYLNNFPTRYLYQDIERLCDQIIIGNPKNDIMMKFYGIETEYFSNEDINLYTVVTSEIKKCPIGVNADPYECNWTIWYQRNHFSHFFLIIDVDIVNKKYICIDNNYQEVGEIAISFDEMEKIFKSVVLFNFLKKPDFNVSYAFEYIKQSIQLIDKVEKEEEKKRLIEFFTKKLKRSDISETDNLETSIILLKLMLIGENKKIFMLGLKHLEEMIGEKIFEAVYMPLECVRQKFILLKNMFMKYAITNFINLEKVKATIEDIYTLDFEIIESIKSILITE